MSYDCGWGKRGDAPCNIVLFQRSFFLVSVMLSTNHKAVTKMR